MACHGIPKGMSMDMLWACTAIICVISASASGVREQNRNSHIYIYIYVYIYIYTCIDLYIYKYGDGSPRCSWRVEHRENVMIHTRLDNRLESDYTDISMQIPIDRSVHTCETNTFNIWALWVYAWTRTWECKHVVFCTPIRTHQTVWGCSYWKSYKTNKTTNKPLKKQIKPINPTKQPKNHWKNQ